MAETAPLAAVKRTRWKRTMGGRGRLSRLGHSMLRWGLLEGVLATPWSLLAGHLSTMCRCGRLFD